MIRLGDLFDVSYGHSLELNKLYVNSKGINFVSRTSKNNGVSAKVAIMDYFIPSEAGVITVAYGGSVLETFLQPEPFYSGYHIGLLRATVNLTDVEKLYYCACIRANKYRYNYGRQANRTIKSILLPSPEEIPDAAREVDLKIYDGGASAVNTNIISVNDANWQPFKLSELFDVTKGKRLTKANMVPGNTPYIGAVEFNNVVTAAIGQPAIHSGGTISVSYNGSVAEAFYQPIPFWATDDVNVLYPRMGLTPHAALFICTVIRQEKYRFNYGRKWHMERMRETLIHLPVTEDGHPDWSLMENYICSLPYSSQINA